MLCSSCLLFKTLCDRNLCVEYLFWVQELYQELQVLDRLQKDYDQKRREEENSASSSKGKLSKTILPALLHLKHPF